MLVGSVTTGNIVPLAVPSDGLVPYYDAVTLPITLGNMSLGGMQWTFPTFIKTLFFGSIGGMIHRVDLAFNNSSNVTTYRRTLATQAVEIPGDYATTNRSTSKHVTAFSGASGFQEISETGILEFATQDKSQFLFHSPQRNVYSSTTNTCYCAIADVVFTNETSTGSYFNWYLGARDDWDVGFIVCEPLFIYR